MGTIIIAILIGLGAGAALYFILNYRDSNIDFLKSKFQKEQEAILQGLSQKKDYAEKEMTEELRERQEKLLQNYKEKEQEYNTKKLSLEQEYESRREELLKQYEERKLYYKQLDEAAAQDRMITTSEAIAKAQDEYNKKLNAIEEDYKTKKQEMDSMFVNYQETIQEQKSKLDSQIKEYEARQDAIIDQFKRAEEIRQKQDFYRIKLTEDDIEDVQKLRRAASTLHNPTVLYKLIWENYYKNRFSELVGRVAPNGKKCGIYKITNLISGKVYIGQTKQTFGDRWRSHVRRGLKAEPGTANKLYTAMWEDGVENFTFEVLLECKPEELNAKEKYFIEFFKSQEWGYNGNGGIGK